MNLNQSAASTLAPAPSVSDGDVEVLSGADVPIDVKSFAGGVEFGAHDHGDSDEAEPCDEAEDRVDRRRRLVFGVGESLGR